MCNEAPDDEASDACRKLGAAPASDILITPSLFVCVIKK